MKIKALIINLTKIMEKPQEREPNEDLGQEITKLQSEIVELVNARAQEALAFENKTGDPEWEKDEHQKKVISNLEDIKALLEQGITSSV